MRASKPLIYGARAAFSVGVCYDVAASAGVIKGDGQNHTPPRIPFSVALAGGPATTTTVAIASTYFSNMTTGEEYRMPPRDHREYVGYFAPQRTSKSISLV